MSGNNQHRATPHDLGAVAAAVSRAIKSAPRSKSRKPTNAMKAFAAGARNKREDRKTFGKLLEVTFYGAGDRYTIRAVDRHFEVWDADSNAVYGPYPTHADAVIAVRAL